MLELIPGNIYVPYVSLESLNRDMCDLFYWTYIGRFHGLHYFLTSGNDYFGPIISPDISDIDMVAL